MTLKNPNLLIKPYTRVPNKIKVLYLPAYAPTMTKTEYIHEKLHLSWIDSNKVGMKVLCYMR